MVTAPRVVKGMHDLLPPEARATSALEAAFRACMERARFGELRTPYVEQLSLFVRSVGTGTDIVDKEIYAFDYRGESLALRPEGTASAVRAYVEQQMHTREAVSRFWYAGPMFRGERPQKGRYRQFYQLGAEVFGDAGPGVDAEVIDLLVGFLRDLGIRDSAVHLGTIGGRETRGRYRDALVDYLTPRTAELGAESQKRLQHNPLRILDSKSPDDRRVVADAPRISEYLSEADRAHFDGLRRLLDKLGTPYTVDERLVRGLDYYTRTLFEIKGASEILGAGDTLVGGGRYDDLVASWGGPDVPAFGFGAGLERLLIAQGAEPPKAPRFVFVAPLGERAQEDALLLVRELRHLGVTADVDLRGGSAKNLFKRADRDGATLVLLIGERELEQGVVAIKELQAESPTQTEVSRAEAALHVAARLQAPSAESP